MDSARFQTDIYILDPSTSHHWKTRALVLQTIDITTPSGLACSDSTFEKERLALADPYFNQPRSVDITLGADVYKRIMLPGLQRYGTLLAQQTIFGWTLTGKGSKENQKLEVGINACLMSPSESDLCHERLLSLVQRFWELEEVPQVRRVCAADRECEEIFVNGHFRDSTGRYTVPLPIKAGAINSLGESLSQARAALAFTHRRMQRDPELALQYRQFMSEYARLGHMRRLSPEELSNHEGAVHCITHHGIWQKGDDRQKFRTVFNASRPTASGHSLNDAFQAGPKLQSSIADIISHWRLYKYAFCADIKMMFRQIRVVDAHIDLQRILWSDSAEIPAEHYVLLTVTYGEECAPYLAIRTLHQLRADEGDRFPEGADAIDRQLYVDDFLIGGHDLPSAKRRRDQLIALLTAGGFTLKKWVSNEACILDDIPPEDRPRPSWVHFSTEGPVSELGVSWDLVSDQFKFRFPEPDPDLKLTKRKTLAELARIFDPLGWLAPITLVAKFTIQDLWRAKLTWDEELPQSWKDKWLIFRNSMSQLSNISIQRWTGHRPDKPIQLHVFSDASRRAMASVIYSRTSTTDGDAVVSILAAKTKLSPIRSLKPPSRPHARMTIPRLELRAALIATRLLQTMARTLDVPLSECHLWCDSQVVLSWIQSDKPVGNDIVDNYVSHARELSSGAIWHYVPTKHNPADIASRGSDALTLEKFATWWTGPEWLLKDEEFWPKIMPQVESPQDLADSTDQQSINCAATHTAPALRNHIEKYSSLNSLLCSTARVRRLYRRYSEKSAKSPLPSPAAPVTAPELRQSFLTCVKLSQAQTFSREIAELQEALHKPVPSRRSKRRIRGPAPNKIISNRALRPLAPFLDDEGILRAGGRLGNSQLPYDEKHPVILDGNSHLARLVIRQGHERSFHAGFRATYARVLQMAWIVNAKVLVKRQIRECMTCNEISARVASQGMAPLPAARVTPARPFDRCGLDYAGPFQVLRAKGRGTASFKGYIALFICLSTKAIHLELVGDLTTISFLGALTRFIGCRGRPSEIWSDNGTNFRGANVELQRLLKAAEMDWGLVEGRLAQEGIRWKFIPPGAPHFGGIWEAGVKSTKAHLQRIAGPRRLTYEGFSTLLVSIEAILNSRPLTPPSGDLSDLDALTPSHFLTGTSATSYPQPSDPDVNLEHVTHWDLVKGMRDRFWARWSREYLNTLLQRPKWQYPQPNFCVGDFVVVVDASLLRPNGRWPMGKITAVHPGPDGLVRTVTIRTSTGEYVRPIVKLARLPLHQSPQNDALPAAS